MAPENRGKKCDTLIIVSPGFPANEADSTCLPAIQTFILSLNQVFPELNIIILSLQYPNRSGTYRWHTNRVYSLNGKRLKKLRPLLWGRALFQLSKILRNNDVIGVLSLWCNETALIGKVFSLLANIRHLIWIQGQDALSSNVLVKWIRPRKNELVSLSPHLADEFEKNHSVRPDHLINNGINPTLIDSESFPRTIDIIGVGSLIPLKQFHLFIDVVRQIHITLPSLTVQLIGDGPEALNLRDLIRQNTLESVIIMRGSIDHNEVLQTMKRAKILLHPSSYEGYSTVCVEALYCGCHVISLTAAEHKSINHWHVVGNTVEMVSASLNILAEVNDFSPIVTNDLRVEVRRLMTLFGYPKTTE